MKAKSEPDFSSFATYWLSTVAPVKYKHSTYENYEGIVRCRLVPSFGGVPLSAIDAESIQTYVSRELEGGLSPSTTRNFAIVMKAIMATAADYGLIAVNPVNAVVLPRIDDVPRAFLTPVEVRRLLDATSPPWALLLALPAMAGLRKAELLALEWSDLSIEQMTCSISKSVKNGVVSTPKTIGSTAICPLPESLRPYVLDRRRICGDARLVFSRSDGSHLADSTPNRVLASSLKMAGLPSIRFHDLRHSWAVAHLQAGTDLKSLAALGRWSSTETLLRRYAHVIGIGGDAVRRYDEFMKDV